MKILEVGDRTSTLIEQLLNIWEASVRVTHLFLSDAEVNQIKSYVPQALKDVEHLIMGFSLLSEMEFFAVPKNGISLNI